MPGKRMALRMGRTARSVPLASVGPAVFLPRWMARAAVLTLMTRAGAWGDSLARGGFGFMGRGWERERSRGRYRRFARAALADAGERGK